MFTIYKPTQGRHTRWITFASGAGIAAIGGYWLSQRLAVYDNPFVQYLIPLAVVAGLGYLLFHLVNRQTLADFLIATEGEMKKVAWSSRSEVIGATKVVIFTTLILAVMLYVVDILFRTFFSKIDVVRI